MKSIDLTGKGPEAQIILTLPALLAHTEAVQVTDPKTNEVKPAFQVELKLVLSPEDFHILTGCLNGTQVTVQVQGRASSQGAEL
jgi:hypothetical protein